MPYACNCKEEFPSPEEREIHSAVCVVMIKARMASQYERAAGYLRDTPPKNPQHKAGWTAAAEHLEEYAQELRKVPK
jgi:hypothetical protein